VLANLCIGSAYAWSVFQNPLIDAYGFTTSQTSLAYTISLSITPFAMVLSGRLQSKFSIRPLIILGGTAFGAGIFLAGFTTGIAMLYLTYGVLGGAGIGTVYGCTVPNSVKWFPDKRGLAGGIIAGGFGFGAVLFAPVSANLVSSIGILATFQTLGIAYVAIIAFASMLISAPPAGYQPEGWNPPSAPEAEKPGANLSTGKMMKTAKFWILWVMYTIGCTAGLMIIGHASPIGQERIGITPAVAAVAIVLLSLANTFGRMFWGAISDKLGRYLTLIVMYIMTGAMLLLLNVADSYPVFIVSVMGIALSFGGFLGIFPSITADNFGTQHLGINYGVMFTAYGLAAFVGPRIAAAIRESSGDYSLAFIIASCMGIAGIILTVATIISRKSIVSKTAQM